MMAVDWNLKSFLYSVAISRMSLWKGARRMRSSVDFWNLRISLKATVPGRKRWGFFMPPSAGAFLRADLCAKPFLGALAPVFLRAVYLVRAIFLLNYFLLLLLYFESV